MTAEIAILNKLAVALAADSAVSIGKPPNLKIYNTVNKIFELSGHHPVGVMVYGRLDFMGIPYEPLIKEYRRQLGSKAFDHIEDYAADFKKYLRYEAPHTQDDEQINVGLILNDFFSNASADIDRLVFADMRARGSFQKSKVNGIAQAYIKQQIDALKARGYAPGYSKKKLPAAYGFVDGLIDRIFSSNLPNATTKSLIRDYAGYVVSKDVLSSYRTGIVIAGFGEKEIFPSLVAFQTDGMVDGKLKYANQPCIDIDRQGPHADILGFAQEDMIKSFLDGIDPSVKSYINSLVEKSIKKTSALVAKSLLADDAKEDAFHAAAAGAIGKIIADIQQSINDHVQEVSANPIRDMVRSMPKQELATLASSLIEITSLKRKVSRDQETVGGEVDVAIISKSEGFVWIKRKHYFPGELNRRFAIRQAHQEEKS